MVNFCPGRSAAQAVAPSSSVAAATASGRRTVMLVSGSSASTKALRAVVYMWRERSGNHMRSVRTLAALALALATALALPAHGEEGGDGGSKKPKHKLTNSDSYLEVEPIYTSILDGDHPDNKQKQNNRHDEPNAKQRSEADHA